jgi:NADH dehydrogenase
VTALVAGATGSLGGKIVQGLLARGQEVRGLVRPRSDAGALARAGVQVVRGDVKDPPSLARACDGVDYVISTVSMSGRGDDSPDAVDARGNQNLFDAARAAQARHVVFVSTIGASPESPVPVFRAKGVAEEHLKASGLAHTILQANAFMDTWFGMMVEAPRARGEAVTLVGESRRRHSFIAERDVAAFAVASLENPAARNATLTLGGPEALSFRDVVSAYEAATGSKIEVRTVAPGAPIPGVPEPVWAIAAALESYDSPIPMEETARAFGVKLTRAREFARESHLASARS